MKNSNAKSRAKHVKNTSIVNDVKTKKLQRKIKKYESSIEKKNIISNKYTMQRYNFFAHFFGRQLFAAVYIIIVCLLFVF